MEFRQRVSVAVVGGTPKPDCRSAGILTHTCSITESQSQVILRDNVAFFRCGAIQSHRLGEILPNTAAQIIASR